MTGDANNSSSGNATAAMAEDAQRGPRDAGPGVDVTERGSLGKWGGCCGERGGQVNLYSGRGRGPALCPDLDLRAGNDKEDLARYGDRPISGHSGMEAKSNPGREHLRSLVKEFLKGKRSMDRAMNEEKEETKRMRRLKAWEDGGGGRVKRGRKRKVGEGRGKKWKEGR